MVFAYYSERFIENTFGTNESGRRTVSNEKQTVEVWNATVFDTNASKLMKFFLCKIHSICRTLSWLGHQRFPAIANKRTGEQTSSRSTVENDAKR